MTRHLGATHKTAEKKRAEREGEEDVIAAIPCESTLQLFDIRRVEKMRWAGSVCVRV